MSESLWVVVNGKKLRPAVLPEVPTPYLTLWEAAAYARLEDCARPDEVIYKAVRKGLLKTAGKVGASFRFTREGLDAWIRGKSVRQS